MLLAGPRNTLVFEYDPALKGEVFKLFATNLSPEGQANCLASLLCCLPNVQAPKDIKYQHVFRVLIMAFIDAVNFDVRAMKKSCVHIVQPDGRMIPFEAFNLLYRDARVEELAARRRELDTPMHGVSSRPTSRRIRQRNFDVGTSTHAPGHGGHEVSEPHDYAIFAAERLLHFHDQCRVPDYLATAFDPSAAHIAADVAGGELNSRRRANPLTLPASPSLNT